MSSAAAGVGVPLARELGPRGSRDPLGDGDPAGAPTGEALAVLAALPSWWERRAHACGLSGRWLDVYAAVDARPPAHELVPNVSEPLLTASPAELGSAYASSLTPAVRARHGRYYTPWALSDHLWTMTRRGLGHARGQLRPLTGLVRDPACGAGVLLLPPLREHLHSTVRSDARVALAGLPNLIEGVDADPAAVWLANVVLAAELLPVLAMVSDARRRPLPALARIGDGLEPSARPARAVVMNPPYGRVRLSAEDRLRFSSVLYGHANLYSLFVAAGLEQLDHDGVLGALVPTSFIAGRYFSNLRAELGRVAPMRETSFVEQRDGVFAGVLQETCLAVFTRKRSRRTAITSINGSVAEVAKVPSPRGPAPWVLPRRSDDAHIAAAAAGMTRSLGEAGWRCSTGPLVWNRRKTDLHAEGSPDRVPVIWAADLDGGTLHRDRQRASLRFLQLRGDQDRRINVLSAPALLLQRTTAPEQKRRIVCAELSAADLRDWGGRVVVENHVNVLRPRDPAVTPLLTQKALAAVLGTRCIDRLVRCLSGSVALSAYELEALPLPDDEVLRRWEGLRGLELERAVAAAYGGASR